MRYFTRSGCMTDYCKGPNAINSIHYYVLVMYVGRQEEMIFFFVFGSHNYDICCRKKNPKSVIPLLRKKRRRKCKTKKNEPKNCKRRVAMKTKKGSSVSSLWYSYAIRIARNLNQRKMKLVSLCWKQNKTKIEIYYSDTKRRRE